MPRIPTILRSAGLLLTLQLLLLSSCASYYRQNVDFHRHIAAGNIEAAAEFLAKNKKNESGKSRLLYFLEQGVVQQMLGDYEASNSYLEKAYIFTEDERGSLVEGAISLLTNPMNTTYMGEAFERVQLHYYKALNFLNMGSYEKALVECRRINVKLTEMNDHYEFRKNRYKQDAFAHNLMGLIFEASGEINDAFISYRNAYKAYTETYNEFGLNAPQQLKDDLLRTAHLNGFTEELRQFEEEFGQNYEHQKHDGGEIIVFWNNGLGPVKDEWSLNFLITGGEEGRFFFKNEELGLSFPFYMEDEDKRNEITDLKVLRIAFPKYVQRQPIFNSAYLRSNGMELELEKAQDINEIAFATLKDRMVREMATSLLRFALKQVTEGLARKKNEVLGMLMNLTNAITEKADTRNWQTLPHSIGYARLQLPEGEQEVTLTLNSSRGSETKDLRFFVEAGKTRFHTINTIESVPPRLSRSEF